MGMALDVSNFDWSIAGNLQGQSPNILSALDFKSITSLGYFIKGIYTPLKKIEIIVYYQQSKTISGHGTDIDYQDDNRSNPIYNLSFISNKGTLHMFKGGGRTLLLNKEWINCGTSIHYSASAQNFHILSPEMAALESTYQAKFKGIDFNVDTEVKLKCIAVLLALGVGHTNYRAEANWNLQDIFMHPVSFSHAANGIEKTVDLSLNYKISGVLSLTFGGSFTNNKVSEGIDTSFLVTNKNITTQFNGASKTRYQAIAGLTFTCL